MHRASHSAIGLPSSSTSASWRTLAVEWAAGTAYTLDEMIAAALVDEDE
jgi:hypothetical protein